MTHTLLPAREIADHLGLSASPTLNVWESDELPGSDVSPRRVDAVGASGELSGDKSRLASLVEIALASLTDEEQVPYAPDGTNTT